MNLKFYFYFINYNYLKSHNDDQIYEHISCIYNNVSFGIIACVNKCDNIFKLFQFH